MNREGGGIAVIADIARDRRDRETQTAETSRGICTLLMRQTHANLG